MYLYIFLYVIVFLLKESYSDCPQSWYNRPASEYCYKFTTDGTPKTWLESQAWCQSFGGDLLWIADVDETNWIFDEIREYLLSDEGSHQWWIGLHVNPDTKQLAWSNGLKYNSSLLKEIWIPGQPIIDSGTYCGSIWSVVATMATCDNVKQRICKVHKNNVGSSVGTIPTTATVLPAVRCGPLWEYVPNTNLCYRLSGETLNWFDARDFCIKHGGQLTSISTKEEQQFLADRIKTFNIKMMWLGLNDLTTEGGWQWNDQTILKYIHWSKGEPNNFANTEDCGAIRIDNGLWNDLPCMSKAGFICQKVEERKTTMPVSIESSTPPDGLVFGCTEGWTAYNNYCYKVINEDVPWIAAKNICAQRNGSIASITSQNENIFVRGLLETANASAWIGLNDLKQESVFEWTDTSAVVYTNWGPNQPNNLHGDEDCVYINRHGGWMDYNCNRLISYTVCKIKTSTLKMRSVQQNTDKAAASGPFVATTICPTAVCKDPDGLSYAGIVGVICLVLVVILILLAFILYSCRITKDSDGPPSASGFDNPLYHGDISQDRHLGVFTISSDKRVNGELHEVIHLNTINGGVQATDHQDEQNNKMDSSPKTNLEAISEETSGLNNSTEKHSTDTSGAIDELHSSKSIPTVNTTDTGQSQIDGGVQATDHPDEQTNTMESSPKANLEAISEETSGLNISTEKHLTDTSGAKPSIDELHISFKNIPTINTTDAGRSQTVSAVTSPMSREITGGQILGINKDLLNAFSENTLPTTSDDESLKLSNEDK